MSITYIPTIGRRGENASNAELVKTIRSGEIFPPKNEIILYEGWPQVKDYDGRTHSADLTIIGNKYGVKLVKTTLSENRADIRKEALSILQCAASTESSLSKSLKLKQRRRLVFEVIPILYAPNLNEQDIDIDDVEITSSPAEVYRHLAEENGSLNAEQQVEVQAIIEGAKALGQLSEIEDDDSISPIARAYNNLAATIYNFDTAQRSVALTSIRGPQRIRGLAGTGKTVIIAMKAALAHIEDPTANILVTYYTRSLRDVIERLITRFYRHFAETDPNWDNIHVRHGWGRRNVPGVYRDACIRAGMSPKSFGDVRGAKNPLGAVCEELVRTGVVKPFYDVVLVDEGQDFPDSFYQMCFYLTKGTRDEKQIIWAYDELQNVFDVQVREPELLFGNDADGEPRISLLRSLPEGSETNDFVLQRSYRNQREVLILAHSIGFGVYGDTVQMLENSKHWEDVGYDIISGDFTEGSENVVERSTSNSPSVLASPDGVPVIDVAGLDEMDDEVSKAASEIKFFVDNGMLPQNIMVISLDDRSARSYFSKLSEELLKHKIPCNNIIKDPYSEPPFQIDGMVTLSTVYRAKGNEAAVVIVLGADAASLKTRTGRNKLFVAFTRTKGWLRIYGMNGSVLNKLFKEIDQARALSPRIKFTMPDMTKLNTIQRGLEEKHARKLEARQRIDKIKRELNLTDEDLSSLIEDD
jgi:superfamily I DNA and RNA helicase